MINEIEKFRAECLSNTADMKNDEGFRRTTQAWTESSIAHKYSYNFRWMGRPIIQYPQDVMAMQELIWETRPDLIIETGIAHGGSLILYASLLQLLGGDGHVVGIDIDIRKHNRAEIEAHPMYDRITMIEGSSIAPDMVERIAALARGKKSVMVVLDSNHTHDHVLQELRLYAPFVTEGGYLVVFDTLVEDLPAHLAGDRPWGPGNNPKTAVHAFLAESPEFSIDASVQDKLLITAAPDGYLKRTGVAGKS